MSNRKILVIDDSRVIRMKVKEMLPVGNFEVLEAKDGLEGYHLIRSEMPQLIMLDFFLPKMSGWEVYQEIQRDERMKMIPLILMSGRKEEVVEKLPEPFEFFAFIEKPFEQEQLVQAIKEAMLKAKNHPRGGEVAVTAPEVAAAQVKTEAGEIAALKAKVAKMELEIEQLKKQLSQIVTFIKKKLS